MRHVQVELALVEALARAEREQVERVVVVADEDEPGADPLPVDREALPPPAVLQGQGDRAQPRERVAASPVLLPPVYEPGVEPERDVVEEEPFARAADVDPALDAAVEGGERRDRVVPVEPEIAGEVVAGAERDDDERHVLLDRHVGDRGERAVTARHPEHVGSGVAGELLQIVAFGEEVHLDAACLGLGTELVRARRGVAGFWVDDQVSLHRVRPGGPAR